VLFVHYSIDPAVLRPRTPFALDLFGGRAWVSLVAFTQVGMRPAAGGAIGAAVMRPVATHAFLNLRTYVRVGGRPAIQFLAEWIPNRLAMLVGPRLYGLPFRAGRLDYRNGRRDVTAEGDALRMSAAAGATVHEAAGGSLDEFLVERYTAVTWRQRRGRGFDIGHAPWAWRRAAVRVEDDTLVRPGGAVVRGGAGGVCARVGGGVRCGDRGSEAGYGRYVVILRYSEGSGGERRAA
jgi:uncharacterized protein YqjF (DUF2071 family)